MEKSLKKVLLCISGITLLFGGCSIVNEDRYSSIMDNIINDYIQEYCAFEHCSDSTFYITVFFNRNSDSLSIQITGSCVDPCLVIRQHSSIEKLNEAIRNDEDMWSPVYGYFNIGQNRWVIVYYTSQQDVPLIQEIFFKKKWIYDKEFEKWNRNSLEDTDIWFYRVVSDKLIQTRKISWRE